MQKILLHICCGPCGIYPLELLQKNYEVTGFYYNPNIQPETEYKKRLEAIKKYCESKNIKLIIPEYNPNEHLDLVKDFKNDPNKRCHVCWQLRLEQTAKYAKNNNFDYFTSTLLISPHQDINKIKDLGEKISQKYNIKFFDNSNINSHKKYKGFRSGFNQGRQIAKQEKMYCQDYCGCIYSKLEKEKQI